MKNNVKCRTCDLCGSTNNVKICKDKFYFKNKEVNCLCVECIKEIDAYFGDFVLVYNGIFCLKTNKGKKLLNFL